MTKLHCLRSAVITGTLVAGATAYAEEPQETPLSPPPSSPEQCEAPPASCPTAHAPQAQTMPQQQHPAPPPPAYAPYGPPHEVYAEEMQPPWYKRVGIGLMVGGGVDDFVSGPYKTATDIGGDWTVRATIGTRTIIGGEVAYIGSAQSIDALGLGGDSTLIGNGVQGNIRLNVLPTYPVQPFLFIGAAWRHYDISTNEINTSDLHSSDDVVEMPFGLGLAGYVAGLMLDVRGEYRGAWNIDFIPGVPSNSNSDALFGAGDRWAVTGNLGMEF